MSRMGIGLQLYTLREETRHDFSGTLRKVAALGYEGVEFAGYGGLTANELSSLLSDLNLQAIGSHVDIYRLRDDLEKEVEFQLTIGSKFVICPYLPEVFWNSESTWQKTTELLNHCGRAFAKSGITFGYHNHWFEFEQTMGEDLLFDSLFAHTSPETVAIEMDVCWVQRGGQDPVQYLHKYAARTPLIHLKDMRKTASGEIETVVIGEGTIDLQSVVKIAEQVGVEWLIVEQDECQKPPFQSVAESYNWLQQNYLRGNSC